MLDPTHPIAPTHAQITRTVELLADADGHDIADVTDAQLLGYVDEADPIVRAIGAYLDAHLPAA